MHFRRPTSYVFLVIARIDFRIFPFVEECLIDVIIKLHQCGFNNIDRCGIHGPHNLILLYTFNLVQTENATAASISETLFIIRNDNNKLIIFSADSDH